MDIEVTQEAFEFSNLLLKYYKPHTHDKHEKKDDLNKELEEENTKIKEEKLDPKEKYSLNYKKFDGLTVKEEEVKVREDVDENAYYQQMACTHDRRKERDLFEKPTIEKLEAAECFKLDGNEAIKAKEYEKSAYFYQKGLLQLDYTFTDNEEDEKKFVRLQEQLHFNMALTKYFAKDTDASLIHLGQVYSE